MRSLPDADSKYAGDGRYTGCRDFQSVIRQSVPCFPSPWRVLLPSLVCSWFVEVRVLPLIGIFLLTPGWLIYCESSWISYLIPLDLFWILGPPWPHSHPLMVFWMQDLPFPGNPAHMFITFCPRTEPPSLHFASASYESLRLFYSPLDGKKSSLGSFELDTSAVQFTSHFRGYLARAHSSFFLCGGRNITCLSAARP